MSHISNCCSSSCSSCSSRLCHSSILVISLQCYSHFFHTLRGTQSPSSPDCLQAGHTIPQRGKHGEVLPLKALVALLSMQIHLFHMTRASLCPGLQAEAAALTEETPLQKPSEWYHEALEKQEGHEAFNSSIPVSCCLTHLCTTEQ